VLVKNKDGKKFLIVRGAPEEILKLSSNLNEKSKKIFKEWFLNEGNEGNRVLGIAIKEIQEEKKYYDVSLLEKDLNFEGCISFYDPIKETTFKTIKKAKKLGLQIKIITGDSKEVAFSVGQKIGLVKSEKETILASEFLKLNRSEQKRLISKIKIFARTDPEQKHKIIKILQENYEVGFLGEGINDAPAIKAAGVSLVVDSASDISRETADIILLEKDLSVIVDGIEEGRKIFANTVKYLKATLASNFGNFYAVAIGSLFINFLPMLPVQILLVNLLSDFPMISIATDSVDKIDTQKPQKYNVKDVVLIATLLGIVSTVFDFMFFGFFYKISPAVLQTNWFVGSILTELVFLFSIRTRLPFYKAEKPSKPIIGLSSLAFLTTIILPYTKIGQKIFRFTPPTRFHLFIILSLVFAYFFCSEIVKNIYYKIEPKKK
jgi:Mg2+-importing ATPase